MVREKLQKILEVRASKNALRSLSQSNANVDFCSNDYLGFAKRQWSHTGSHGSTGSRLITGNTPVHENAEKELATFYETEAALLFNSGYDANIGFFSAIPQKENVVIYDQLCHASIRDGLRLSKARSFSFKHNDTEDLEQKISRINQPVFVVVESIYSMDGDEAPLIELSKICEKYNANLIVDEAHATGIFGKEGRGLSHHHNISTFARIHTFGKALGCHGAVVVSDKIIIDYLINFARSFIYTTALPPHSVNIILQAHHAIKQGEGREKLHANIGTFTKNNTLSGLIPSNSPIQSIVIQGNEKTKAIAAKLQNKQMDLRPILYPTVPEGTERIRICLHSYNSEEEIIRLCDHLNTTR